MAADGYIRIDTKINQAGAKAGLAGLTKSLKGFAVAAGLAFGVAAISGFAKSCIKLASDLAEVQNVVDVTFGSAAGKINNFAKTAATGFGLSELAAKQYTGTMGAMLKSMGFGTAAAADMSIEMASLAGDMASFYNLDTDEAFMKIRSGISGETEPLKQLGVNLSEANLQAYALAQGMTQGYSSLSEQNKALIRYNYLLDVTKDAQGDFARTSGSWANQVRVLKLQLDSLKATLGGALISALTPVLGFINRLLGALNAAAAAFVSLLSVFGISTQAISSGAGTAADAMDGVGASADAAGAAASGAGSKAKKGLASFDELNVLTSSSGGGGGGGGGLDMTPATKATDDTITAMDKAKAKMQAFFARYAEEIALVKGGWERLKTTVSGIWSGFAKQFADTDIGGAAFRALLGWVYMAETELNLLIAIVGDLLLAFNIPATVEAVLNTLADLWLAVGKAVAAVTPGIMAFIDKGIVPIVQWVGGVLRDALAFLGEQFKVIGDWFAEHEEDFTVIGGYLGDVAAALWTVLEPLASGIWEATKLVLGATLKVLLQLSTWAIEGAVWLIESWYKIRDGATEVFTAVSNFLTTTWNAIWGTVVYVWGEITGFFSATWTSISDTATAAWTAISGFFTGITDGIKLAFNTAWEGIKGEWTAVAEWFNTNVIDPITKAFQAFKTSIIGVWDAIWAGIKGVINSILGGVESFINGIVRGVNVLISGLNTAIGLGSEVTEALGLGSIGPITPWSTVSLPRLAQGAVIPPNREFAAILGDQRSGVNIETPLDTMVEAFKAALGDMGGGGNNQPIYITVESKLDGKTVARNQARYLPKEYGRIGASAVRVGGLA